jgi:magnesium chelatase family protein
MRHCAVAEKDLIFLENAMTTLGLSARAHHRILKLSRTIADLDDSDLIAQPHLQEALSYRFVRM